MDKNRYYIRMFPTDMVPDFRHPPLASIPVPRDSKMFEKLYFLMFIEIFNFCLFFFDPFSFYFWLCLKSQVTESANSAKVVN